MISAFKNSIILSIALAIIYALITYAAGQNKIVVSYTVVSDTNNLTQLYWKTGKSGEVVHENRSIKAYPAANEVSYTIDGTTNKITLVPIVSEDYFSVSGLSINYSGLIVNIPYLSTHILKLNQAIDVQNSVASENQQFEFRSQSTNPLFTFSINYRAVLFQNLIINLIIINLLILVGSYLLKKFSDAKTGPGLNHPFAILFLLIPMLYLASPLSAKFANPFSSLSFISTFTLISYAVYLVVVVLLKKYVNAWSILVFALIGYILLPDAAYKFNFIDRKIFSTIFTPVYHWRISKSTQENFVKSGAAYIDDMRAIADQVQPYSSFISDEATSYYLLTGVPLYATVSKAHHGGTRDEFDSPFVSREFQQFLCDPESLYNNQNIEQYLDKKSKLHREHNWPLIRYIVLNKDPNNRILRRYCLKADNPNVLAKLNVVGELIYQGQYLDVYEFNPRFFIQ